jgi:hypothetical protein
MIHVPAGCLDDLSGAYVHALNPSFHYLASDDGGTLLLAMERSHGDAGLGRPEPNLISVSLSRTAKGFVGETQATVFVTSGRTCPVDFPTELVGCEDGGLVLKSAVSSAVDESCRPSQGSAHSPMVEHRLIRAAPRAPASSADAGASTSE